MPNLGVVMGLNVSCKLRNFYAKIFGQVKCPYQESYEFVT